MYITREIPMSRVSRITFGPDFRGHKPIQVCLVNYRDKEEILRKARLLKGSNIYISEDFSRKVREHRNELVRIVDQIKFQIISFIVTIFTYLRVSSSFNSLDWSPT